MEDKSEKRHKKKKRRHRKGGKSTFRPRQSSVGHLQPDKSIRASVSSKPKPKRSKKRSVKGPGKQPDVLHLNKTIETWKKRWKNKLWRRRWKHLWGKNRWKVSIRKRWNSDKKWRRKWMKKILKKWWDKKWRRKWQKRWIDHGWLNKWNKVRLKRRRVWKQRWVKSGAKKMGLTFNEFLLAERRLKALQKIDPATKNRQRREKRFYKEKRIREQQEKRKKSADEELSKKSLLESFRYWLYQKEYYGPETFEIRPAVIQFNFYMLNGLQGLAAFLWVLYFHLTNQSNIPREFVLHGLYTLVYFANAMDFYGSIFGMVTSYHLESYYGRGTRVRRRKSKQNDCSSFCCCPGGNHPPSTTVDDNVPDNFDTHEDASNLASVSSGANGSKRRQTNLNEKDELRRRQSRGNSQDPKSGGVPKQGSSKGSQSSRSHRRKSVVPGSDSGTSRRHQKATRASSYTHSKYSSEQEVKKTSQKRTSAFPSDKKAKVKCKCRGLLFLHCCFIRLCFRPGRSSEFINRMGYCSWILLQLAWFFNIFFSAYYSWLETYYKNYEEANARCNVYPRPKHCDDFDSLYSILCITVGVTFVLRNIFVFIIGMCFSERYLKRCQSMDPNDEMASTCSDTDIDYSKVPRQILIPHLLSNGKYPYVLPGPSRPVDYMLHRIKQMTEKHQKEKLRSGNQRSNHRSKRKHHKPRRRILSTYDRETSKVVAEFKQIRRVQLPLEKGKRKPIRIPVSVGVPDVQQLPPDLMTAKAWAWLYDDSDSTESDVAGHNAIRRSRPVKWRRSRKRKINPVDSAVLTVIHRPHSKTNIPVEQTIKPKLENLSDRDSTDGSWSARPASLYESASGYSSENERQDKKRESDRIMELMTYQEVQVKKNVDSLQDKPLT